MQPRSKLGWLLLCIQLMLASSSAVRAQYIQNGYAGKSSFFPGDTAEIYISGTGNFQNVTIYLLDALKQPKDSVITNLIPQSANNPGPWQTGFGYVKTFNYIVPNLPSGYYSFNNKVFFIIKDRTPKDITVVVPTNTIAAYDSAGGKSLYNGNSTGRNRSSIVSFKRPLTDESINYSIVQCNGILKWLIKEGNISYRVIADIDMDDYSHIADSKVVMVIGHSEYWTRKARRNFDAFVDAGGNAAVLSGNTSCWQVRYSADGSQLICYRSWTLDPGDDSLKTVYWTTQALLYPMLPSFGIDWLHGAMGLEKPHGWNGIKVTSPGSPIYSGTGLNMGDTVLCTSSELDGAPVIGFDRYHNPLLDTVHSTFCLMELAGYDYGKSPPTTQDTAYGTFVVCRKNINSGVIINVARNEFTSDGPPEIVFGESPHPTGFAGKDSLKIQRICRNIVDILVQGRNAFGNPASAGIITGPDTCLPGRVYQWIDSGKTGQIQWQISNVSASGPFTDLTGITSDTVTYSFNIEGTYWFRSYLIRNGCACIASNVKAVYVQHKGASPCEPIMLGFGPNGPFSTADGTILAGEPAAPLDSTCHGQSGWCSTGLLNTLWLRFTAPASGRVRINTVGLDTRLAVWQAASCDSILSGGATLLAANDDDPNYQQHHIHRWASWIDSLNCLSPGQDYYVQLMPGSAADDTTTIMLVDKGAVTTSFKMSAAYCSGNGDSIELDGVSAGGTFSGPGISNNFFLPDSAGPGGPYVISYDLYNCYHSADTVYVDYPLAATSVVTAPVRGDSTGSIEVTVTGGTPPYTFAWDTHGDTKSLNNLSDGIYAVTITDSLGCTYQLADTLESITATGIENISPQVLVNIFPTPSSNEVFVDVVLNTADEITISVKTTEGKEIMNKKLQQVTKNRFRLNFENESAGIYLLTVQSSKAVSTKQIVISR